MRPGFQIYNGMYCLRCRTGRDPSSEENGPCQEAALKWQSSQEVKMPLCIDSSTPASAFWSTRRTSCSLANSRFDDWGYDELLPATPGPFRHNILFQTGTEISIVFRVFGFDIRKPTSCELRWYASRKRQRKWDKSASNNSVQATPVCTLCLLLSQRFEAPNLFRL